jgi:hypothetical protein
LRVAGAHDLKVKQRKALRSARRRSHRIGAVDQHAEPIGVAGVKEVGLGLRQRDPVKPTGVIRGAESRDAVLPGSGLIGGGEQLRAVGCEELEAELRKRDGKTARRFLAGEDNPERPTIDPKAAKVGDGPRETLRRRVSRADVGDAVPRHAAPFGWVCVYSQQGEQAVRRHASKIERQSDARHRSSV